MLKENYYEIEEYYEWLLRCKAYIYATRLNQSLSTPRGMSMRILDEPIIKAHWEHRVDSELRRIKKLKSETIYTVS